MNNLNKMLQGRKKVITQCYDSMHVQVEANLMGDTTVKW